jgi:hypothetical protein
MPGLPYPQDGPGGPDSVDPDAAWFSGFYGRDPIPRQSVRAAATTNAQTQQLTNEFCAALTPSG